MMPFLLGTIMVSWLLETKPTLLQQLNKAMMTLPTQKLIFALEAEELFVKKNIQIWVIVN